MIANAYNDIAAKDATRKSLNDAVAGYLAGGGRVTDLCPPQPDPKPISSPELVQQQITPDVPPTQPSEELDVLEELLDIQARAAELHHRLDWIEQALRADTSATSGDQTP